MTKRDWRMASAPSLAEIDTIAREAFAALPARFRRLAGDVVVIVQEFADDDVVREMELESPFEIMGLYHGVDVGHRGDESGTLPSHVFLYRRPMLDYWAEHEETLGHLVRHVLVHEIGHHLGLSDEEMEAIEAEADQ